MKRLIYQVSVGRPSKLYKHCIDSVKRYCEKYNIDHIVQTQPKLWIKPDPFFTNRSEEAVSKTGCLPIFEKENAFDYLKDYDQVAIIDADIYIREDSPNIFEDFEIDYYAFGAVCEREMPITEAYMHKLKIYSRMQYATLHGDLNFSPNYLGYEFFNMGLIILNSKKFLPYLKGESPKEFIGRSEFKNFVDGVGNWKWSTDQTLLNYFLKKYNVPTKHMDWKWNGLFTANTKIKECYFIHFFLKDKLPNRGESVDELMRLI